MSSEAKTVKESAPAPEDGGPRRTMSGRVTSWLSPRNIGAVYVWIAICIVFTIISPDTFASDRTATSILNQYAISGLLALAIVAPLAAGQFDLSIGYTMSFGGIMAAHLLSNTDLSPWVCLAIAVVACAGIGLINAFVVVGLGVNSFIGTLGTGAIVGALTLSISGDKVISTGSQTYGELANAGIGEFLLPVFYALVLMVVLGFWLERTRSGRYTYAVGFDPESSRLSGLSVNRLSAQVFVISATIAGFAGCVLAARVSAADPNTGNAYLIPAFSAAFLGATQFRQGRFNTWGTVVAVLLLGTGSVGLLIAGGPTWAPRLFEGVVLISAVALTSGRRPIEALRGWALRRRTRKMQAKPEDGAPNQAT